MSKLENKIVAIISGHKKVSADYCRKLRKEVEEAADNFEFDEALCERFVVYCIELKRRVKQRKSIDDVVEDFLNSKEYFFQD